MGGNHIPHVLLVEESMVSHFVKQDNNITL